MRKIQKIEEYYELLKHVKETCGRFITNSYLSVAELERYIKLERLYCQEQEYGFVFLCDEEKYYRLLYWLKAGGSLNISSSEKPIAVRTIYKQNNKREELISLEEELQRRGFQKEYSAFEMCVPLEAKDNISKQNKVFLRMLQKGKFYIADMRPEDIDKMHVLREDKDFHIYNFPYKTQDEYYHEIANNQYISVFNENDEMCACIYTNILEAYVTGDGICVEDKYKGTYGLGAALMCHILNMALNEQDKRYVSWCETENHNSIKFHNSIGFVNTGKVSDEWILK